MAADVALVVPVVDELLPRAAVALGDDRVVELLRRDALEGLGIAWRQGAGAAGALGLGSCWLGVLGDPGRSMEGVEFGVAVLLRAVGNRALAVCKLKGEFLHAALPLLEEEGSSVVT